MKRFKITNNKNGLKFQVESEALVMQPEYGLPERWVSGFNLTDEGKLQAIETRVGQGGLGEEVVEYKLAAEYTITEENIDSEINAKIAKNERMQALKDKHKAMK